MALEQERAQLEAIARPEDADRAAGEGWSAALLRILGMIIALEVGILLAVLPWLPYWSGNFFSGLSVEWNAVWVNPYFRGAVSGLGLVNVYISVADLVRLIRLRRR